MIGVSAHQFYNPILNSQFYNPILNSQFYNPILNSQFYNPIPNSQFYNPILNSQFYKQSKQVNFTCFQHHLTSFKFGPLSDLNATIGRFLILIWFLVSSSYVFLNGVTIIGLGANFSLNFHNKKLFSQSLIGLSW